MEYDGRIQSSAKWNLRVSAYCRLLGLRALRQSNMPFDHFEHRKRLTMRTLDSLAALHTCHIFLQRGKPKHRLALESSMMWGRPPRPVPKEEGSNLIKACQPPITCMGLNFGINSGTTHQVPAKYIHTQMLIVQTSQVWRQFRQSG